MLVMHAKRQGESHECISVLAGMDSRSVRSKRGNFGVIHFGHCFFFKHGLTIVVKYRYHPFKPWLATKQRVGSQESGYLPQEMVTHDWIPIKHGPSPTYIKTMEGQRLQSPSNS